MSVEICGITLDAISEATTTTACQPGAWMGVVYEMADLASEEAFYSTLCGNAVRSARALMFDAVGIERSGHVTNGRVVKVPVPDRGIAKIRKFEKDTVSKPVELPDGILCVLKNEKLSCIKSQDFGSQSLDPPSIFLRQLAS